MKLIILFIGYAKKKEKKCKAKCKTNKTGQKLIGDPNFNNSNHTCYEDVEVRICEYKNTM